MNHEQLEQALAAARFLEGDRFELAIPAPTKGFVGRCFVAIAPAVEWLASLPESNVYLCLNPIKPEAPNGRAGSNDIAAVRVLLVDVDTGDPPSPKTRDAADPLGIAPAKRAAALEVAAEILDWLVAMSYLRPAWVSSGRGQQLWLPHPPHDVGDPMLKGRVHLVRALAARFNRAGLCHVDTARTGPNQLARLPYTKNMKTGELATLVEEVTGAW